MKAGDIVKVTDWGEAYSTNYFWFDKFKGDLAYRWMICYAFGDDSNYKKYYSKTHPDNPTDTREYTVLFVGDDRALITERVGYELYRGTVNSSVYLVGVDGLEVVYSKNSAEDTSEKNADDESDNKDKSNSNEAEDLKKLAVTAFVNWSFS